MAACCHFGVGLRNQLDHNFFSQLPDGPITLLLTCYLLPLFSLLLSCTYYSQSDSFSPVSSYWDKLIQVQLHFSLCLCEQKYSKSKLFFSLCLSGHNIVSPIFFLTYKISLSLLTQFILLPLESKQCPLTLASVLACADSADELRF